MGRRLFVGNLPFETTSDDLRTLFSQAGTCDSASVMTDRMTGKSRGFGFVEMSSDEEAAKAISSFNGYQLSGRSLNVNEARERGAGGPPRSFSGPPSPRSFTPDFGSFSGFDSPFGGGGEKPRKEGGSRRNWRAKKRSL
jgi:cold-inducible RNA-binding protein